MRKAGTLDHTASDKDFFDSIQFPVEYTFPQDAQTGAIDRSFEQAAFRVGQNLNGKPFSLVNLKTGNALSLANVGMNSDQYLLRTDLDGPNCPQGLEVPQDECLAAGTAVGGDYSNLRSDLTTGGWTFTPCGCFLWRWNGEVWIDYHTTGVGCIESTSSDLIGLVCRTRPIKIVQQPYEKINLRQQFKLNDNDQLESVNYPGKVITASGECNGGEGLVLGDGTTDSVAQKWRFYDDGLVNLNCGRTNGKLAITAIEDDSFDHIPNLDDVHFSLVNPSTGKAISAGAVSGHQVSCF